MGHDRKDTTMNYMKHLMNQILLITSKLKISMGRALSAYEQRWNTKKKFNTKPDGVRNVGRPKLQWDDGVDQDMRI
jgi:hypothetical protein